MELRPSEKLIIGMLADVMKTLGARGETDPELVMHALSSGNTWALEWQYPGIFETEEKPEKAVHEVANILTMWRVIEQCYKHFGQGDRARIDEVVGPLGRDPHFDGFDGNNEGDHYSIASMFVRHMGLWSEFHNRSMNSHAPSLDRYRNMLAEYGRRYQAMADPPLSVDDMIAILQA